MHLKSRPSPVRLTKEERERIPVEIRTMDGKVEGFLPKRSHFDEQYMATIYPSGGFRFIPELQPKRR